MDKFLNEEGLTYLWSKVKEQKGEPGPQGDSGVYIGTTPGETDKVWIDTSSTDIEKYLTEEEVKALIQQELGVIENGTY